ncbi:Universal stress protein A family protein C25B2.10 [Choanephora cucurbitarum]|uniref:Universal stress protein A family protein C25B2.10 n=1 Tax=Choanephora cucurbitarum TaxID=101091 RepID=A0A1C7NIC4_9FUNG|nr:Universal stress protein A family protein C25B2.10 [Choanephora cucurbitarum]
MSKGIPIIQAENYVRGVSFDTMTDQDQPDYSFTLRGKTQGYQRTRRSRTFMVATDLAPYSDYALDWAIENIVDSGDEIIALSVLTVDMSENRPNLSAMLRNEELKAKERASTVMSKIMSAGGPEMKISAVIEFVIGKVQETIQNMISVYQPSMLIVGTRGMSELKGMFINSVSKYCLQHSPVPVVVVRPEDKVKKQLKKAAKKTNRLSGMFRISSHSSISSLNSKGSDSSDSSSEDEDTLRIEKKVQRLSVFDKIGRRSRSSSPARPLVAKK